MYLGVIDLKKGGKLSKIIFRIITEVGTKFRRVRIFRLNNWLNTVQRRSFFQKGNTHFSVDDVRQNAMEILQIKSSP